MKHKSENLEHLLAQLVGSDKPEQIDQMAQDIRVGDELMGSFATPALSADAISRIQTQVSNAVSARKRRSIVLRYCSAAAAVLVVACLIGLSLLVNNKAGLTRSANSQFAAANHSDLWTDTLDIDAESSIGEMVAEIDSIAEGISDFASAGEQVFSDALLEELNDMEILGDITDFWKG